MNFLAHLYLSGKSPQVMIGNFIGDFVKGKQVDEYKGDVRLGILLHREIDYFTDGHPVVHQSKNKLRKKYRHYAGVIVDIFYDHFLAKNWGEFHETELRTYVHEAYKILNSHQSILPAKVKYMLPFMIKDDWLVNYSRIEGIARVLKGLSRRTKFDSKMDQAPEDLKNYYHEFEQEFLDFFPQLISHTDIWKLQNQ